MEDVADIKSWKMGSSVMTWAYQYKIFTRSWEPISQYEVGRVSNVPTQTEELLTVGISWRGGVHFW